MLIDSHTHVNFAAYDSDREEVIKRALGAGVWMVNVGTQQDTSRKAVELTQNYEKGVYAAVGLHPIHTAKSYHDPQELGPSFAKASSYATKATEDKSEGKSKGFASRGEEFDYEYYKKLALDPKVVAIGECGLDYYRIRNHELGIMDKQKNVFEEHIRLAAELKKPLMIHCRPSKGTDDAYYDLLNLLEEQKPLLHVVAHFYAGSLTTTNKLLTAGFYFTFGGVITFVRDYDEVIKYIPLDRILLETDAPYVTPEPHRGKRNEPVYIAETAKKMAELKGVGLEKAAETTTQNALTIFKIPV